MASTLVTDADSVRAAVEGRDLVFNATGIPEQWLKDEATFDRVNARGTENVLRAAREAGVRRVVHTSTIDVFHADRGERSDETTPASDPKGTAYERSKQHTEELALAERGRDGERYILCDRHVTLRGLAESAKRVAGEGRVPPVLPVPAAKALAAAGETVARLFGVPPLIARGQLHFLLWNAQPDSSKAQDELGSEPTPLDEGLATALR